MKNKIGPALTPAIVRMLRGDCSYSQEVAPLATLLMDAYNDGKDGANEEKYPRDFDIERVAWCDAQGDSVKDMTEENEDLLRRIMELERLCWEMGCVERERGAVLV